MHWAIGFLLGLVVAIVLCVVYVYIQSQPLPEDEKGPLDTALVQLPPVHTYPTYQLPHYPGRPTPHVSNYAVQHVPNAQPQPQPQSPKLVSSDAPDAKRVKVWTMKQDNQDMSKKAAIPAIEEYNEIRTFNMSSLPYTTENLGLKNCVSAEVLRAVIPRGEYTIDATENNIQVRTSGGGAYTSIDIAAGDYNIAQLVTAITAAVSTSGYSGDDATFVASYNAPTSTVTFANPAEDIDVIMNTQLAYTLGFASAEFTTASNTVTGANRVDLFGNRTVQIRTTEFGGPDGHYNNIMQEIHISGELTQWENTLDPRLTERRFRQPRNVGPLNFSVLTRHPSQTLESDYKQLALNGVVMSLTVVFKCLRYSHAELQNKELELA